MTFTSSLLSAVPGLRHAFFSREGGVSAGIYESLNGGIGSHDDPAHVIENRRRMAEHLGVTPPQFLTVSQIHSPNVAVTTTDRKSTRLNSSHNVASRMPSSA